MQLQCTVKLPNIWTAVEILADVADVDSIDKSQFAHRDWAASEAVHPTALHSTIPTANLAGEQHRRDSQLGYGISEQQHQAPSASREEGNVTLRDSPKLPHHHTHVMPEGRLAHGWPGEGEQHTAWHVQLEEVVLQTNSAISNVMVVGHDRPFLSCFISLKTAAEVTDMLQIPCLRRSFLAAQHTLRCKPRMMPAFEPFTSTR